MIAVDGGGLQIYLLIRDTKNSPEHSWRHRGTGIDLGQPQVGAWTSDRENYPFGRNCDDRRESGSHDWAEGGTGEMRGRAGVPGLACGTIAVSIGPPRISLDRGFLETVSKAGTKSRRRRVVPTIPGGDRSRSDLLVLEARR